MGSSVGRDNDGGTDQALQKYYDSGDCCEACSLIYQELYHDL